MEPERWKTIRRCHECLMKGNTNYLVAQKWGRTEDDFPNYRLTCPECGFAEQTKWSGL
jgi:hypothetical protein